MTIEITTRVVICISDNNRKVLPGRKTGLRAGMKKNNKVFLACTLQKTRTAPLQIPHRIESVSQKDPKVVSSIRFQPTSFQLPSSSVTHHHALSRPETEHGAKLGLYFSAVLAIPNNSELGKSEKKKQSAPSKALLGKSIAIRDEPKASQPTQRNNIIKTHLDSNSC